MAKKVLISKYYTFTPATRTVVIPKGIQRENLVLITNVTQNKVIYNFSDPNLTATTYTVVNGVTTIALNYNTTTMSSTDSLQFVYDDTVQEIIPGETFTDPVQKMRVSTPQSLIDTDFEYGTQQTKWENLAVLNGRPSFFVDYQSPLSIFDVRATNGSKTITLYATYNNGTGTITTATSTTTVTGVSTTFLSQIQPGYALYNNSETFIGVVSSVESDTSLTLQSNAAQVNTGINFRYAPQTIPSVDSPIQVQDTLFTSANGGFLIESTSADIGNTRWTITYRCSSNYTGSTGSIYNTGTTIAFSGLFYSNSAIALSNAAAYSSTAFGSAANDIVVVFTTSRNHGLTVGNLVYITGQASVSSGTNPGRQSYVVVGIYSPTKFSVIMPAGSLVPNISSVSTMVAYGRNEAVFQHRPYDGGVRFSVNNTSHNYQALRQTRRYFRYQSGKGIQFSTGTVVRPNYTLDALTYTSGAQPYCTGTTKEPHNLQPGDTINIFDAVETGYNGNFTVIDVNNRFEFTYYPVTTPSTVAASGFPQVSITNWYGSSVRIGMFDQQNGFFFEYDGQTLSAVKRSSTTQLSGLITATNGSDQISSVTTLGTSKQTKFTKQLQPGEWVVIRGASYRVMELISDTRIRINPEYRGANLTAGVISKTTEIRYPQSEWNIDRCDGYGPSGFTLNLNKMQMFYADYAWYGAGAIRFGFKEQTGNIVYTHRVANSNVNTEAYMRSGNLPGRYETNTFSPYTYMTANFNTGTSSLSVASTTGFPNSGTLLIANPGKDNTDTALTGGSSANGTSNSDYYEYVTYSGKTATSFTVTQRGCGLGITGSGNAGARSDYFITSSGTVTSVSGSNTVTTSKGFNLNSISTAINMAPIGSYVTGTNIPENTYITNYNQSAQTIELSQACTASGAMTDFLVYGMGSNANGATNNGPSHIYNANGPLIGVYLHSTAFAPTINHWGTSVIMDGRYDDDKSLVFTAGNSSYVTNTTTAANAIISLRSGPSVDNGAISTFGQRELVNRMQLKLNSLGVTTNGAFFVRVILNGRFVTNTPTFNNVGGSSLSQVAYHPTGTQITGGETLFAFYTDQGGGGANYSVSNFDLVQVRDLGNSIMGGGASNSLNLFSTGNAHQGVYPDGPDIITVVASNVLTPIVVAPTTLTVNSPTGIFTDVTGIFPGYIVTANAGSGIPVGSVVSTVIPVINPATGVSTGNFYVTFSKNSTSVVNGFLTLSPPGNLAARLSWTEAQA
jgi:hypothetical protein